MRNIDDSKRVRGDSDERRISSTLLKRIGAQAGISEAPYGRLDGL